MSRRAIILAGGMGTRLRPYTVVLPKPLTDTAGNPLYYYSNPAGGLVTTTCATGIPDGSGLCNGIIPNTPQIASQPFKESFLGNSAKPRLSVGFGVNWTSKFGPLRIDIARALIKKDGDDDKLITFNVGTQL